MKYMTKLDQLEGILKFLGIINHVCDFTSRSSAKGLNCWPTVGRDYHKLAAFRAEASHQPPIFTGYQMSPLKVHIRKKTLPSGKVNKERSI